MSEVSYQEYEVFEKRQESLLKLIFELQKVLTLLDMPDILDRVKQIEELIKSDSFKVLVVGEIKRGKSTFINAMLGEEVLPASILPCTAIISEIKWGEEKKALLYPLDIEEQSSNIKAQEIPIDELSYYTVISDEVKDAYEKVEVFWPLDICRNGVEIIDSPGLNEHDARQKITTQYLSTADAILFVLSCETLASKSELEIIDNILRPAGYDDIFFVCNRFDVVQQKEKKAVEKYGISRLAPRTKGGEKRVFFISALEGLEGRLSGDLDKIYSSGITNLERELESFLANDRGAAKLLRISRETQIAIYDVRRTILDRESMLKTNLEVLESRLRNAQTPLRQMETEANRIVDKILECRNDLRQSISPIAYEFYIDIAAQVPGWVADIVPTTSVSLISFSSAREQTEELVEEVLNRLSIVVESELICWQKEKLQPLIAEKLSILIKDLDERGSDFLDKVDTIKFQISGSNATVKNVGLHRITPIERILSATSGFFVAGLGSAGLGAIFGYKEMAKSILPQLGIVTLTASLVGFNPIILIPAIIGGGFLQALWTTQSTNRRIKEEIGKRYSLAIRSTARQRGIEVADAVDNELEGIQEAVRKGLSKEIESIRHQVALVIRNKMESTADTDTKLMEIDTLRRRTNLIDEKVGELIANLAIPGK